MIRELEVLVSVEKRASDILNFGGQALIRNLGLQSRSIKQVFKDLFWDLIGRPSTGFLSRECDDFIKTLDPKIIYSSAYIPTHYHSHDITGKLFDSYITMPWPSMFATADAKELFYFALFHELTHWTGTFLLRDQQQKEDSFEYVSEEIIANFGCAILLHQFGLLNENTLDLVANYYLYHRTKLVNIIIDNQSIYSEFMGEHLPDKEKVDMYINVLACQAIIAHQFLLRLRDKKIDKDSRKPYNTKK